MLSAENRRQLYIPRGFAHGFQSLSDDAEVAYMIAIDNVLWHGDVIDPGKTDADTEAIRAFNLKLHADKRVSLSLIPLGDGLTLACKL